MDKKSSSKIFEKLSLKNELLKQRNHNASFLLIFKYEFQPRSHILSNKLLKIAPRTIKIGLQIR